MSPDGSSVREVGPHAAAAMASAVSATGFDSDETFTVRPSECGARKCTGELSGPPPTFLCARKGEVPMAAPSAASLEGAIFRMVPHSDSHASAIVRISADLIKALSGPFEVRVQ